MTTGMIKFPVTVDEFDSKSYRFVGQVATIHTLDVYEEVIKECPPSDNYTYYDADGRVIL